MHGQPHNRFNRKYIKILIVIYFSGLIIPPEIFFLPMLYRDALYTILNVHCARNSPALDLVWCKVPAIDTEQDLSLKAALSSVMIAFMLWLSQQEVWAVRAMRQWHCCILYLGQSH